MGPTGYGGLFRRLTRTFTGGVEPDNNTEAQIQRDSPRTNSGRKMCPNKYPGYFMTVEILREFLKKNFGLYDPQIKVIESFIPGPFPKNS